MVDVVLVGCGGVGLPLAVALASRGVTVVGFDVDRARLRALAEGALEVEDEGLGAALKAALASGALSFVRDLAPAAGQRAFIIAVPTPVDAQCAFVSDPLVDAFRSICAVARDGDLVGIRSTVPVGMLRKLAANERRLLFASCPDRSVAGRAFDEQFRVPNLVGGLTPAAAEAAREVFAHLGPVELLRSPEAAETAKLFANIWRDAQFALANQFALFCESVGVDFGEVREAGGKNFPRFAPPRAGPVGGPCLTKDVYLLSETADAVGADVSLLLAARALNNSLAGVIARRICARIDGGRGGRVAVLGLAFKGSPPTLDRRGSFGVDLTALLEAMRPDIEVRTWDPAADPGDLRRAAAVRDASVVVLANDHAALGHAGVLSGCARGAVVFDLCGMLPDDFADHVSVERFGRGQLSSI